MAQITVDLTNADSFDPIPTGAYETVVSNIELRDSKSSEWQYLNLELTVLSGEYANRKLWLNLSLSPKASWRLKKALTALGFPKERLTGQVVFDPDDFIGAECVAEVIQAPDPRSGETRNEVKALYAKKSSATRKVPSKPDASSRLGPVASSNPSSTAATAAKSKKIPNIR